MTDIQALIRADAASRLRALTDLDATLLVEAGAGSGKTSVLAGRIALLLAAGRPPETIAAISFTEASASELRERVDRFVLGLARGEVPRDLSIAFPHGVSAAQLAALQQAALRLDALTCTTIHGFCRTLLAPWPVEAGIDPGASVTDSDEVNLLFDETLQEVLRERLRSTPTNGTTLSALFLDEDGKPEELIAELAGVLRQHRGATLPVPREKEAAKDLHEAVGAFRKFVSGLDVCEEETASIAAELCKMAAALPGKNHGDVAELLAMLRLAVPEGCRTGTGAFASYRKKGKWQAALRGRASKDEAGRINDDAAKLYAACKDAHAGVRSAAAGALLARLDPDLKAILRRFQQEKRNAALLDFDDLLYGARDLLAANLSVRAALAHRFRHVLVDEFQDTDPLQAEILWRLCGNPPDGREDAPWTSWRLRAGALFLVGDPKQAIYRFRGADVGTYVRAREALRTVAPGNVLPIGRNFRSVAPILDWVNNRFAAPLGAPGQPGFAPLFSTLKPLAGRASVLALEVASDDADANSLRDAEAERVAEICCRLIGALAVRDRNGGERPCQAGDIALLAPTGTELWRYEKALERRSLPVATQAGKGFFRRQEVQDLIGLAGVLADSRDTLALGALLRGPLVGLTEEALLDALEALPAREDGNQPYLGLWLPVAEIRNPLLCETLKILQGLAKRARATTPYVLLAQAVDELRIRPILRRRHPGGAERALANVDAFLEMARGWETRGLVAFARAMRAQWKDQTHTREARPDAEQEAVSLITMHAAKGLEWAVVIPINTAGGIKDQGRSVLDRETGLLYAKLFGIDPPGLTDAKAMEAEQQALERQRLWYVAATRARDLLLLPRMAYPLSDKTWHAAVPLALEALAAFDAADLLPSALPTHEEPPNLQDEAVFTNEASLIAARTTRIERVTPSRAEAGDPGPAIEVMTETAVLPATAPQGGRGRGLVLHKLMEEVLSGETEATDRALRARAATLVATCTEPVAGADPAELAGAVLRTLALPDIVSVRDRLVAEYPLAASATTAGGEEIVLGIADAVALSPQGYPELVVDWKSDVAPAANTVAHYREQVRAYLRASGAVRGLIVFMTTGGTVPVNV